MTVSGPDHPATDDPQASLRIELLGKLVAAQMALEKVASELSRNGASTSAADSQLSLLAGLQTSIATASAASLSAMSGAIAAAVAQSKTLADQAREQATAAAAGFPRSSHAASMAGVSAMRKTPFERRSISL